MMTMSIPTAEFERAWALYPFATSDERSPLGELRLRSDGRRRSWTGCDPHHGMTILGGPDRQVYDVGLSWALLAAVDLTSWSEDDLTLTLDDEGPSTPIVRLDGPGGGVVSLRRNLPYPDLRLPPADGEQVAGVATVAVDDLRKLVVAGRWRREWDEHGNRLGRNECWLSCDDGSVVISTTSEALGRMDVRLNAPGSAGSAWVLVDPDLLHRVVDKMPTGDDVTIRLSRFNGDPIVFDGSDWQSYLMPLTTPYNRLVTHLEGLLGDTLGQVARIRDDDGDYPLRLHGIPIYGRLHTDDDSTIWFQVFAVLAGDIAPSPDVYQELNDLNANGRYARLFFVDGQILAEVDLLAVTLDADELLEAIDRITTVAHEVMPTLTIVHGGSMTPDDADRRWAAYRATVIEAQIAPGANVILHGPGATVDWPFPGPVHIITGWNPAGRADVGDEWNRNVNREIAIDVIGHGGRFVDGIGRSSTGHHAEEGLVVWGLDRATVRNMGRRASQDAIFEVDAELVRLVSCSDDRVDTWPRLT